MQSQFAEITNYLIARAGEGPAKNLYPPLVPSAPKGIPLSLNEARLAAKDLREGAVDREYYPWIIEQLCDLVEGKSK